MNTYTRIGIAKIDEVTKTLPDLNKLNLFLSNQTDANALKILKLIILSSESHLLEKTFDINYSITSNNIYVPNKSIIGNLSKNTQYLALDLMDLLIQYYNCNLNLKITNSEHIFDKWINSFTEIENDQNKFYKRYDLINKKLDIIEFMINNNILTNIKLNFTKDILEICVQNKYDYNNNQLIRIQKIINKIEETLNFSKDKNFKEKKIMSSIERRDHILNELNNFNFSGEQYHYVNNVIPQIIKKIKY